MFHALVTVALLLLPLAVPAATLELESSLAGCSGYVSGAHTCAVQVPPGTPVTFTWRLQTQENLNGYDLEVRWDPSELTLTDTAQLLPTPGTPFAWTEEPAGPADSRALVLSLTPGSSSLLFELTFSIHASPANGQPDLEWFANGNGLSPGSVTLSNPGGVTLDLDAPAAVVPAVGTPGLAVLSLTLAFLATRVLRSRQRAV